MNFMLDQILALVGKLDDATGEDARGASHFGSSISKIWFWIW
jgi:hypothetical protein